MKTIKWLDEFAKAQAKATSEKKMTKTASAKKMKKVASVDEANYIILDRSKLPNAKDGNTVKYRGAKWRVVKASYRDAKGPGIALKRVAEISTKPINSAAEIARQDPGNVYDYNVRETSEVPDFQAAAAQTEQAIAADAQRDMTTPAGRYTNPSALQTTVAPEAFEGVAPEEVSVIPEENGLESFDAVDTALDADVDTAADDMAALDVADDIAADDIPALDAADDVAADDMADEVVEDAAGAEDFSDIEGIEDVNLDELDAELANMSDDIAEVAEDEGAEIEDVESEDAEEMESFDAVDEVADETDEETEEEEEDVDVDLDKEVEAKARNRARSKVARPQSIYATNPILSRIVNR